MPDEPNAPFFDANRAMWDETVPIHMASRGYDIDGFLRGEKSLYPVEMAEMGDVRGKSLVHLQCHFGVDTLNWARLGAKVTGLDFSEPAVAQARDLATQIGIADATFVQSNVYDAVAALDERFDIVYTGIGALCWLPDIRAWAQVVASVLKPGGFLYLYEAHPMFWSLDFERKDEQLAVTIPYFETQKPTEWTGDETYVDGPKMTMRTTYEWNHGLGEIVTALIDAGMRLDFLHEHKELAWQGLPWMVSSEAVPDGAVRHVSRMSWSLPEAQRDLCPVMYSIKATRN
jgi:SAM-dependent methyltransferase